MAEASDMKPLCRFCWRDAEPDSESCAPCTKEGVTHKSATYQRTPDGLNVFKLVRVRRDVFFLDGRLKAQAGALGLVCAHHPDGRKVVVFDYHAHENAGLFIEKDGGGAKTQPIGLLDLEDVV